MPDPEGGRAWRLITIGPYNRRAPDPTTVRRSSPRAGGRTSPAHPPRRSAASTGGARHKPLLRHPPVERRRPVGRDSTTATGTTTRRASRCGASARGYSRVVVRAGSFEQAVKPLLDAASSCSCRERPTRRRSPSRSTASATARRTAPSSDEARAARGRRRRGLRAPRAPPSRPTEPPPAAPRAAPRTRPAEPTPDRRASGARAAHRRARGRSRGRPGVGAQARWNRSGSRRAPGAESRRPASSSAACAAAPSAGSSGTGASVPLRASRPPLQCMPTRWEKPMAQFISTLAITDPGGAEDHRRRRLGHVPRSSARHRLRHGRCRRRRRPPRTGLPARVRRHGPPAGGAKRERSAASRCRSGRVPIPARARKSYSRVIPGTERVEAPAPEPDRRPALRHPRRRHARRCAVRRRRDAGRRRANRRRRPRPRRCSPRACLTGVVPSALESKPGPPSALRRGAPDSTAEARCPIVPRTGADRAPRCCRAGPVLRAIAAPTSSA